MLALLLPAAAQAATITGKVVDDRNGDGALRAGEPGLAQVVVYLDEDGDGALDGDRRCTAAATEPCRLTDGNGLFTLSEIPPGGYAVRVVVPDGWRLTTPAAVDVLLLDDGAVESDVDFGVFLLGAVQGAVFADANGNAGRDDGEPLLPGWTVFDDVDLDGALERGEPATATATDGAYQLDRLDLGNHAVRLRRRCSFAVTLPPPPGRHAFSITTSGQVIGGRDFGVRAPVVLPGDGNRDQTVSAADLVAVARAVGTAASPALDANGDGMVTAADLVATAANIFDCAGLAPAPPSATPTATVTATATSIAPTATASATAPPGSTATSTATRTTTPPAPATSTFTRTPTSTLAATATASPTAPSTATRTSTSGPAVPPEALAGTAVQLATGMSAIPAVITALVGGIEFGDALVFDPAAQTSGVGGPAGACPLGGSASRSCSAGGGGGTLAIDFDSCRVATASGSVVIDPLPAADPAVSLLGGFCIANLPLPPWNATIGISAAFRNPLNMPLLTATADLTGTVSPTIGGSCGATAATLALTGTIRSQFGDGSAVAITFANTAVLVTVMQFNADCVPVRYRMTFNGPATLAVEAAAGLTSGTGGGEATDVVFDDFVVDQNASGSPTQTFLGGDVSVPCGGATLNFGTTQLLAQLVGAPCPHGGILRITAGTAVTNIIYHPAFQVGIDVDDDGFADSEFDSCQEAPPLCGGAPPTATASATATRTRTTTPTITRTNTPGPSPTASATVVATPTASVTSTAPATPTRTPTATVSSTRTATPTPSVTPTNAAPQEYCDSLPGPALIPDANIPGIDNDIVIGTAETIADLNVALSIAHTWVGDLRVVLTHVNSGASVVLLDLPGRVDMGSGCGQDEVDAVFDDSSQRPAEERCAEGPPFAAIDGSVAPLGPLSVFNGQSLAGTWRLNVSDRATQDTGALLGWCLRPNSLSPVVRAFTCDDTETECVQVVDEPFSLAFRYADPDGDAATWHLTGRFENGSEFNAGSGPVIAGSGGLMTLNFDPFTCATQDCPDTVVDYLLTVRDAAGRESPVQRLRLFVTLFEL